METRGDVEGGGANNPVERCVCLLGGGGGRKKEICREREGDV